MLCPGLSMYRLRKGLQNRTWECGAWTYTSLWQPSCVLVQMWYWLKQRAHKEFCHWRLPGPWPYPALHFTQLPTHALGLRGDPGKCLPGRVTKDSVTWERVLLSEMAFCFSGMSQSFPSHKLCIPWKVFDWFLYKRNCRILCWYTKLTVLLIICKIHVF